MHNNGKPKPVFSIAAKHILATLLFLFPVYAIASDPSGLFWPVVIALIMLGTLLFSISTVVVLSWVENSFQKSALLGFFFGLFLGPPPTPGGEFVPNITNLIPGMGGQELIHAFIFACVYALIFLALFFAYTKLKRL